MKIRKRKENGSHPYTILDKHARYSHKWKQPFQNDKYLNEQDSSNKLTMNAMHVVGIRHVFVGDMMLSNCIPHSITRRLICHYRFRASLDVFLKNLIK